MVSIMMLIVEDTDDGHVYASTVAYSDGFDKKTDGTIFAAHCKKIIDSQIDSLAVDGDKPKESIEQKDVKRCKMN